MLNKYKILIITATLIAFATCAKIQITDFEHELIIPTSGRIVGGKPSSIYAHPHQVSLFYGGNFLCSASIMDRRYIMTAAHCLR